MSAAETLHTSIGDIPLEEVALEIDGRTWRVLHSAAVLTRDDEQRFLREEGATRIPYGIAVWPSSLALAYELATRSLAGLRVLELGAGTGLPGLVAASRGAQVVQSDRQRIILHVCARNAARNAIEGIEHRIADWTEWTDDARYDLIIGADILYAEPLHADLRRIFERNLAPGGTVLIGDPFREVSIKLLEALEADGWQVALDRWTVGITPPPRRVGVFALTPPPRT